MHRFDNYGYDSSDSHSRFHNYYLAQAYSGGDMSSALVSYSANKVVILNNSLDTKDGDTDIEDYPIESSKNKALRYFFLIFELIVAIIVLIPAIALLLS